MDKLQIIYEDNHLLALNKAAGVLVQADRTGDESLLERTRKWLRVKYQKPGNVYLGLLHRLDRPASGVILFAKTSKAASRISAQFREHKAEKIYLIVVHGKPKPQNGKLQNYIKRGKGRKNTSQIVENPEQGQDSVLYYKTRKTNKKISEIEVKLETGRKHQIRIQFSHLGYAVIGDFRYGSKQKLHRGKAIALHAATLTVIHPTTREKITIKAPLPRYWPEID